MYSLSVLSISKRSKEWLYTDGMKRKIDIAFSILVLLMLLLPLLMTKTGAEAVSDVDGRRLANRPVLADSGYTEGMESYLEDRLGLGDQIRIAFASINDVLADELIDTTYQNGKKGWTFLKIHNNIEYSEYNKVFAEHVFNMQKYCESRGSRFYYVFNPEKESIYRSLLPNGVNYDDSWVDEMLAYMNRLGVNCIDLRDALIVKSGKDDVFNRKVDPEHWNHTGAFYGMQEITRHMHKDDPAIMVLDKDEYAITSIVDEKMNESNPLIKEDVPSYTLISGYKDMTGALESEISISELYPHIGIFKNESVRASAVSKMLVLDDYLYGEFALSRARETVEITGLQNAISLDYYYNIFRPEIVVFETLEYTISEDYYSTEAMTDKTWVPAVIKNYPYGSYKSRREELLAGAEETDLAISVIVDSGKALDRVHLSGLIDEGKYVYLLDDDGVLDLQRNDNGVISTTVRHNELRPGKKVILFYVDRKGNEKYTEAEVVATKYMADQEPAMHDNILCFSRRPLLGESDYANGIWRAASSGTGIRELVDVETSNFSKAFHITGEAENLSPTEVAIDDVPIEYGKKYVLSCYAKGEGQLYIEKGKTIWEGEAFDVTDKWKQYSYSFTVGEQDGMKPGDSFINVYFGASATVDSDLLICGMKLERSDTEKATVWTANPDDKRRRRVIPY